MTRLIKILIATILTLVSPAMSDDLYHVVTETSEATSRLSATRLVPIMRVSGGYIIAVPNVRQVVLETSGLEYHLVATNVDMASLAVDNRADRYNAERFEVIYEEGLLRLLQVNFEDPSIRDQTPGLVRPLAHPPRIVYREPVELDMARLQDAADLDSLTGLVRQDSLESYSAVLQDFYRRVAGTSSNIASRYWLEEKFAEFGYDSIVIDTFEAEIDGHMRICSNVVVVKLGTEYPGYEIIIGAHRDAEVNSPGADDNGSGACGVLEIARLLRDLDTRLTMKFILFDAEEWGLLGSYHYVEEAADRGDSIVVMLNMDMISYYENSDHAYALYPDDSTYAVLWATLADSLQDIDLTTIARPGFGGSDHYPFGQAGYSAVLSFEYIFSTVSHSVHDSTTYMNFDYYTRMVRGTLATACTVDATHIATPSIRMRVNTDVPETTLPDLPLDLGVNIQLRGGETMVPGSCQLHFSVDGAPFDSITMTPEGAGDFKASLPPHPCNTRLRVYFSVAGESSGSVIDPPPSNPFRIVVVTDVVTIMADDFSSDLGWLVTGDASEGFWERQEEIGSGCFGAPEYGFDETTACFVTGVYPCTDVDNGTVRLLSPIVNVAGVEATLRYARWYTNQWGHDSHDDSMMIFVSDSGGACWTLLETVGPVDESSGGWYFKEFLISDYVTPTDEFRVRFDASDFGTDTEIEAAIDAFEVVALMCSPIIATETLPDWTCEISCSQQIVAVGGQSPFVFSDMYADLNGSGLAVTTEGVLEGAPTTVGPLEFTALAIDAAGDSAIKPLSIQINAPVDVSTDVLPDGTQGQEYACPLEATGGTGSLTWTDVNGDLNGTGLALSAEGEITGTPIDAGVVMFTVRAEDEVGSVDETALSVTVGLFYICGDINGDFGAIIDIADMVFLVDYMFTGGPAPVPEEAADVDGSGGIIDIADLVYLADYMFSGGPDPTCQ